MSKPNIIAGIDIGTSKISVIVCALKSSDDIEILGMGTSILKGVQKGIIVDKSLFTNALQNCLKRAQATSEHTISEVFVNLPAGNSKFVVQTGIVQNQSNQLNRKLDCEKAMKKAVQCVEKKDQSVLHMFPINQRVDGRDVTEKQASYFNMEVDTGIILGDSGNLNIIFSTLKKMGLKIKGVISDYLAMTTFTNKQAGASDLIIDIGSQTTSFCLMINNQIRFAHTILIGSDQITHDLSVCLKCSYSEAERVKILYGELDKLQSELSKSIIIQSHSGPQVVKQSLITSIIESRVNQLFQLIHKYLVQLPSYENIYLLGSGANLAGLTNWTKSKFSNHVFLQKNIKYNEININSNYLIAIGQIIYGFQIGLLKRHQSSLVSKLTSKIFKN